AYGRGRDPRHPRSRNALRAQSLERRRQPQASRNRLAGRDRQRLQVVARFRRRGMADAVHLRPAWRFAQDDRRRLAGCARRYDNRKTISREITPPTLRLRSHTLDLTEARVMGILNVTPDSFYDQGRYSGLDRARARAAEIVEAGAS